jgi:CBS domain-containing protein
MRVEELMTKRVKTVAPGASLKQVAALLIENGISGVPVCDVDGRVLGVVSEADVLLKEQGVERAGGRLARLIAPGNDQEIAKAEARTAGEAMTAPAITINPFRSVHEAGRLMLEHGINRLPVVREDRLVGIVTRADLVRAFDRGDDAIAQEIRVELLERSLWLEPEAVAVEVERGQVTLRGEVEGRSDAQLIERLVARVVGVVGVTSELTWRVDDTSRKYQRAQTRARS